MTIFGITGDLAQKKLLPALFHLYCEGVLPTRMRIIGFSHHDFNQKKGDGDDHIRAFVTSVLKKEKKHASRIPSFVKMIHYQRGDFTDAKDFGVLAQHVVRIEDRFAQCANKLFYLAVPPSMYHPIFINLAKTGLTLPCSDETGWARVLVEKPFGEDINTAKKLDRTLGLLFDERQIFRIDHYLEKEMLQDILMFRFSNTIFEPIWNSRYVEQVHIKMFEQMDITGRGQFYDATGTLRDVGQNHALQMLALIAMDRPEQFDALHIRAERAKVLARLSRPTRRFIKKHTVRAQYEGFIKEKGVHKGSETETYFFLETRIRNDRWNDVPFIIEAGKGLHAKKTEIDIHFRPALGIDGEPVCANRIRFTIQPEQEIRMSFASKKDGYTYEVESNDLVFMQKQRNNGPDAYQKLLHACFVGDQTMFTSSQEVYAAWKFITPILRAWERNVVPLHLYKKGVSPQTITTHV